MQSESNGSDPTAINGSGSERLRYLGITGLADRVLAEPPAER